MHCILEGLAHTHFCEVPGLTMTQASAPAPIIRVFMHEFTPANPADTNMTAKEIKQVVEIYTLLMLPAEDGDNN